MIDLYSAEAEHAVLGAMIQQPHLIDVISDDLSSGAFYYAENRDLYRLILSVRNAGGVVDILTLGEAKPMLDGGQPTIAYAGQLQLNTPSVANAKEYARIVRDRAVARQIADVAGSIHDIASSSSSVEDKVAQVQALVMAIDTAGSETECQMIADIMREHIDELERRHQRTLEGIKVDGLLTGIPDLDTYTQGLKPGQMIVLGGRPSMGKTTIAMNVASDVAINQKRKVLVISLEMTRQQLVDRLIASVGGISLKSVKDGSCCHDSSAELNMAARKMRDASIAVSDVPSMTMPRIRSIARRQSHRMGGLDLLVIDYLGLIEGDGNGRVDDVTTMSRQIKLLARELGVPVIVLCQLNRGCESRPDKRPVLSDLRESGAIEQDADMVLFVYRDEVYFPNTTERGVAEILIRKNRDGEIGTVRAAFQGDKSRFVPLAATYRVPDAEEVRF